MLCVLSHGFPTTHSGGTPSPLSPGKKWVQEGRAICSRSMLLKAQSIASATSAPPSVSCLLRGADPASWCHLDIPDSVQVASCWRQWLHPGFVGNATPETLWRKRKLNPKLQTFVRTHHPYTEQSMDVFKQTSPIVFHLHCWLTLTNSYNATHPGKIYQDRCMVDTPAFQT